MAWEIKNKDGDVTKVGGKLIETQETDKELTDFRDYPSMPEAPSQKYDRG